MEIAKQFGIEPTLLLAQIVNFLVILVVLKKFFYKPIVKTLEERKAKIAESLKNADEIEAKLQKTEDQSKAAIEEARNTAKSIVEEAKTEAQRINDQAQQDARKTQEEAVAAAQSQIETQKEEMKKQLEGETLTLISGVLKKVLGTGLSKKDQAELTKKAAEQLSRQVQ